MSKSKLSFSSEVAETLGLHCAIVLDFYEKENFNKISSSSELTNQLAKHISFIDEGSLAKSINKLVKYKFINFESTKNNHNYEVKKPTSNKTFSRISQDWMPSKESLDIIEMTKISKDFLDIKLKEFKVYWIERAQQRNNWNITFIDFIRREWAKESSSNKGLPFSIDERWYPGEEVFDILELSNISKDSALKYLREFILYWKDNGSAFTTWNSKYIEHVKRRYTHKDIDNNEKSTKHSEPGKYSKAFNERKEDDSWAKEIKFD